MSTTSFETEHGRKYFAGFHRIGNSSHWAGLTARLANRWGFSAIPLYLLAGLAFGKGGLLPLQFSEDFVHVGAEIGVVLLLFMLGLEYTSEELSANLRAVFRAAWLILRSTFHRVDRRAAVGLDSTGGHVAGWGYLHLFLRCDRESVGGTKTDEQSGNAIHYFHLGARRSGHGPLSTPGGPAHRSKPGAAILSIFIALVTVAIVLFVALRYGKVLSRFISHQSDEVILFSIFGLVLLIAGIASRLHRCRRQRCFPGRYRSRDPSLSEPINFSVRCETSLRPSFFCSSVWR